MCSIYPSLSLSSSIYQCISCEQNWLLNIYCQPKQAANRHLPIGIVLLLLAFIILQNFPAAAAVAAAVVVVSSLAEEEEEEDRQCGGIIPYRRHRRRRPGCLSALVEH